nr:acyl-coenzyme A diphosphatase FITM2 [Anolis sagrei ordinatus]
MEYIDRSAGFLTPYVGSSGRLRRMMPWVLLGLMMSGSLLKEWAPLPETYMSNKRNLLNIYFVKFAWAWTLFLLLPFISITNYIVTGNARSVAQRLSTLLVGTAIWYVCTGVFLHIEDMTGVCYSSPSLDLLQREHSSKILCHQAGGFWHGFDISGHSFLLSYCALMIMEEIAVMHNMKTSKELRLRSVINGLFLALSFLTLIWIWMFLTTAIYFHEFSQKLFGTFVGIAAWYGTYRFWYLKRLSPGLPPQRTALSSQKYNRSL